MRWGGWEVGGSGWGEGLEGEQVGFLVGLV